MTRRANDLMEAIFSKRDECEAMREKWMTEKQKLEAKERDFATLMTHAESLEKQKNDISDILQKMEESSSKKDSEIESYRNEREAQLKKTDERKQEFEECGRKEELRIHAETKQLLEQSKQQERALEDWNIELENERRTLQDEAVRIRCKYVEAKKRIEKGIDERKELETMIRLRNAAYDKKREDLKFKSDLAQYLKSEQVKLKRRIRELEDGQQGAVLRRSKRQRIGIEDSE
ncbi:hypothetical protein GCK72_017395 [Caenorhabditis remanei]|uniref:Uncharacterized protein n=1 Tax=Caenorhabditis remanei TaxID=31234 RepID=A0A6A5G8D8_CAERE|nr:hypothetical protein GCK72_017395 [Caenorhabditis remanei]KAF1750844.1 hypothetical protein GCK72_017395 [Caenorhabditis remanei]